MRKHHFYLWRYPCVCFGKIIEWRPLDCPKMKSMWSFHPALFSNSGYQVRILQEAIFSHAVFTAGLFYTKPSIFHYFTDIFIDRAKGVRNPTFHQPPASIRVYNDSRLRYSKRINFDVACQMDFHLYPVDKQSCEIKFESFGHTTQDLSLKWIEGVFSFLLGMTLPTSF